MRIAAIDIGTVTTRLLIADVAADGRVTEIERRSAITRLGEGWTSTGTLSDEAIERVVATVASFAEDIRRLEAVAVRAVATSAARDAGNGDAFLARLEAASGVRPAIITGAREAQLAFLGATHEIDAEDVLVADLGGGSTELVLGSVEHPEGTRDADITAARSIDVGSRRMTETYLRSDPPTRAELDAAATWAVEEFRPFFDALRARPRSMIALAGTATSLSAIHQGLAVYDPRRVHESFVSGADLANMREDLAAMDLAARKKVVGLEPERADVIVAGALILETLVGLAGLDGTTVSEHDLLYGLLLEQP